VKKQKNQNLPTSISDIHDPHFRVDVEDKAAILEYDAGLPRPEAERRAILMLFGQWKDYQQGELL
jgi:hypothetical protein